MSPGGQEDFRWKLGLPLDAADLVIDLAYQLLFFILLKHPGSPPHKSGILCMRCLTATEGFHASVKHRGQMDLGGCKQTA